MQAGFRMSIGAELGDVARVNAAFAGFAAEHGMEPEVRRGLQVVLDELLANIVSYGLAGRAGGQATVDIALSSDGLVVTLVDNGSPFDPFARAAPDTTLSVEERPIGGLGIHLVRQMMDEASYQRRGDQNVTILTKRLTDGTSRGSRGGE